MKISREEPFDIDKLLSSTDEEIDKYVDDLCQRTKEADEFVILPLQLALSEDTIRAQYRWFMGQFVCQRCGWCCVGTTEGIPVASDEIERLADHAGLSKKQSKDKHTFTADGKRLLKEPCVFYKEGCSIYDDRPRLCREYPILVISSGEGPQIGASSGCPGAVSLAKRVYKWRTHHAMREE